MKWEPTRPLPRRELPALLAEIEARVVTHAREHGFALDLAAATLVARETTRVTKPTTWSEVATLVTDLADDGATRVNLAFCVEHGATIVRYDSHPIGEPVLPPDVLPMLNATFDSQPLVGYEELRRRHPWPAADSSLDGFGPSQPDSRP